MRTALSIALLSILSLSAAGQTARDLDFMEGTWSSRKDGFSFTTTAYPILGGMGFEEVSYLDENNREVSRSIYLFRDGRWMRTTYLAGGATSTFVQRKRKGKAEDGRAVALEQIAYNGRELKPVSSRVLMTPGADGGFISDWQSKSETGWTPRPEPYRFERVERPAPPAGGKIAFISNRSGNWEIMTMNIDGSELRNLTQSEAADHFPKFKARGQRVAFLSQRDTDDGSWLRYEVDLDGTDLQRVDIPGGLGAKDAGKYPEVHPSGSYLVYSTERDGNLDLYVSRFDGGGERRLTRAPGPDYGARWSPDGERVLFISERDGNSEIYTVAFDGSDLRRLTNWEGIDRYAEWSPDGSRIVFGSDMDAKELELYVMDPDGEILARLTDNRGEDGEPCWSPDGRHIVFRSNAFDSPEICRVEVETGEITRLTEDPGYDGEPVWAP